MTTITYVNHNTAEVYATKTEAMNAYRAGTQIDLYDWSDALGEWVLRGCWEI